MDHGPEPPAAQCQQAYDELYAEIIKPFHAAGTAQERVRLLAEHTERLRDLWGAVDRLARTDETVPEWARYAASELHERCRVDAVEARRREQRKPPSPGRGVLAARQQRPRMGA